MNNLNSLYSSAKELVISAGFSWEIDWQDKLSFSGFNESDFLREYAWVVLCGGFKESIIRKHFNYISMCFCDWESAHAISTSRDYCVECALLSFNNPRKINAISDTANLVDSVGFDTIKKSIHESPIKTLNTLPQIGKITATHLAKNLGYPTAKADRHLIRLASHYNSTSVEYFCNKISELSGDPIQVVDIVLWRYMVLLNSSHKLTFAYSY